MQEEIPHRGLFKLSYQEKAYELKTYKNKEIEKRDQGPTEQQAHIKDHFNNERLHLSILSRGIGRKDEFGEALLANPSLVGLTRWVDGWRVSKYLILT